MRIEQAGDTIPTRASLVSRLKDLGDQESWRDFFITYRKLIFSVAKKAGLTEEEAQDVVQETVVSVAKTMPGFKYDPAVCSFKTWLQHLTRKRIVDQLRKRPPEGFVKKARPEETPRTSTADRVPDPAGSRLDALWNEEWQKSLLEAAMKKVKEQVNPRHYQLFHLYVIKQLPILEVARSLRVSVGQVYLAKHRVSALIKKEIKSLEAKLL